MKNTIRIVALLLVIASMCSLLIPAATAASSDLVDVTAQFAGKIITLRSVENGKYLCADSNVSGTPLRATTSNASTWETFQVSAMTNDGWIGLKSHNGKWLSTMADTKNNPINARYDKLKSWECFRIYLKDGNYYIKSQANNKWLSVRVDTKNAPVQSCGDSPSTWERLDIRYVPMDVTSRFAGRIITIRSLENGKYLCADSSSSGTPLNANKSNALLWETFQVSSLTSDGWVGLMTHTGKWLSAMIDTTDAPINARYDALQNWESFRIYEAGTDYYIKAKANGKWLCIRVDTDQAPAQACGNAPQSWERLDIRLSGPVDVTAEFTRKSITLRSLENGKYLCADSSVSGTPLLAIKDNAAVWETFLVSDLTSDGWIGLMAHTGNWISTIADTANAPVQAAYDISNHSQILEWERFRIYRAGTTYFLKAKSNGKWLCTRVDTDRAPIQACASEPQSWERFDVQVKSFDPVWPCKNSRYVSVLYDYWKGGKGGEHKTISNNKYNAIDISEGGFGDPILAIESGKVVKKGSGDSLGYSVTIEHGNGLRSVYGHMNSPACVNVGDYVIRGQTIGYMGSTGNSTGPHLHLDVHEAANPTKTINPWATWYQGKLNLTINGNCYRSNERYLDKAEARDLCEWLDKKCKKLANGDYKFEVDANQEPTSRSSVQHNPSSSYYPTCSSDHTSIVNALNSLGVDSSYAYRKQIAAANGISGYSGTASQNTQMLSLLKAGALKKPGSSSAPTVSCFPRYTGSSNSLVTGLNAVGADSSYSYRKQIAAANGISGYSGTAAQNTQMLNWLKAGTLKKP